MAVATGIAVALGGCAWTPGGQALTAEEYRTLEERWAGERERRLQDNGNQTARLSLSEADPPEALVRLLAQAEVPVRVVQALELEDGRRRQDLRPIVRVSDDTGSRLFDPAAGGRADTSRLLLWESSGGGGPVLGVEGRAEEPARHPSPGHGPAAR